MLTDPLTNPGRCVVQQIVRQQFVHPYVGGNGPVGSPERGAGGAQGILVRCLLASRNTGSVTPRVPVASRASEMASESTTR